jgi:ribosomal protein S4
MATFHKGNITVNGKTICVAWYDVTAGATVEAEVGSRNVKCQLALTSSAASNCNWSDQ